MTLPYPAKPWRVRWRYLLSFYVRVIGFLLLSWAEEHDDEH